MSQFTTRYLDSDNFKATLIQATTTKEVFQIYTANKSLVAANEGLMWLLKAKYNELAGLNELAQ